MSTRGTPTANRSRAFPVLVEDPDKVASVDPTSNEPTFNANAPGEPRDRRRPGQDRRHAGGRGPRWPRQAAQRSSSGTNEEYLTNQGDEGGINASDLTTASLGVLGETGLLNFANGRVYAIKSTRLLGRTGLVRDRRVQVRTTPTAPRRLSGKAGL